MIYMKKFLTMILIPALLISCTSADLPDNGIEDMGKDAETILIADLDDIRTTFSVGGRLCTLTLSAVTGEKFVMVEEGKRYMTYHLEELPAEKDGKRWLYSTSGNINIILSGHHIYISIGDDWIETYIEREYLSPFIFATHA